MYLKPYLHEISLRQRLGKSINQLNPGVYGNDLYVVAIDMIHNMPNLDVDVPGASPKLRCNQLKHAIARELFYSQLN